ncbi:MAG: DUF1816 domain-containing protein [Oscillatoria sp. SIO1A7]|nr:DUF1816 domain-containing protein [Oscillatoria sp. SIO1A7]
MKALKELWVNLLNFFGLSWWVEIVTETPRCTYYFGPFGSKKEAEAARVGYIEDLEQEGAQGLVYNVKRCKPVNLTVSDDPEDRMGFSTSPVFSGQF